MPDPAETLQLTGGGPALQALLARAAGMDTQAAVRIRQLADGALDVFVTTPFEVIAARRAQGSVSRDGAAVSAAALVSALAENDSARGASTDNPVDLPLGPALDAAWPGALPPAKGFELLDTLPVAVVRDLSDKGQKLTREFSGPMGPPASLLNQTVVAVEGDQGSVDIPMRMIFACTNLSLIPGFAAPMDIPRHLRVSKMGRWVRVDAPFGSVYHSTRLSLV